MFIEGETAIPTEASPERSPLPPVVAFFDCHLSGKKFFHWAHSKLIDSEGNLFVLLHELFDTPAYTLDGKPYLTEVKGRWGKVKLRHARICVNKAPDDIVIATVFHLARSYNVSGARFLFFTLDADFEKDALKSLSASDLARIKSRVKIIILPKKLREVFTSSKRRGKRACYRFIVDKLCDEFRNYLKERQA